MSEAGEYATAQGQHARDASADWDQLSAASGAAEFFGSWLAILCAQVQGVNAALLVLGPDARGGYSAAAVWPDATRSLKYLGSAAERALNERRGFVDRVFRDRRTNLQRVASERRTVVEAANPGAQTSHVGYPVEVSGVLYGAVILDIDHVTEQKLQQALRQIHWGSAWLVDQYRQQQLAQSRALAQRLGLAHDVVATALQERRLGACAMALVNELAVRLDCERVALGLEAAGSITVQAISNTASFDARSDAVRLLGDAMDEVLDLDLALVHPPLERDAVGGMAHAVLSAERAAASVMSVPLMDDTEMLGVLTFERLPQQPFLADDLELGRTLGALLGPVLALKRNDERSLWQRARLRLHAAATALFGPRRPGLKLVAMVVLLAVTLPVLITTPYRVAAKTMIEGSVQRAVVAPFQGFVASSLVRAGETVSKGQVLARLEDRELRLEQQRWASEAEQMERRYRQAAATQDRAAMSVAAAQESQARAQLALVEEHLARATLVAPFEGLVVVGDLSRLLGSPVEQGQVLFEVAPLDAYRVVLSVDERDIDALQVGQRGELALSSLPYELPNFVVRQITPMSTPQDGRNYFRVEAQLDQASKRLRPGMEGIGKVEVGERRLIWIWTHSLVDWLRLWTWEWIG